MIRFTWYMLLSFLLCNGSLTAQDFSEIINEKFPAIDSLIRHEMETQQIPAVVIGIGDRNGLVKLEAYGLADVQNDAPVRKDTRFELASITKQFTSSAILILEQQGKLSIEDKICEYIDYCPDEWSEITIRHLMSHTSGLPGLFSEGEFNSSAYSGYSTIPRDVLVKFARSHRMTKELSILLTKTDQLDFTPGAEFNYSDVGYLTLGIIIDNLTGSYRDFLQKEIFDPAGMKDTYILDQQQIHMNEARGYSIKNDTLINIKRFWENEIPSHYGIFSNVEDLYRWSKALDTEQILTNESKEKLWARTPLNDGSTYPYGLGWNVDGLKENRIVTHTGITGTSIAKLPEDGVTIIVLTNLGYNGNDRVNSSGLSRTVMDLLDIARKTEIGYVTIDGHVTKPLSKKIAKKLLGAYHIEKFNIDLNILEENGEVRLVGPFLNEPIGQLDDGRLILLNISNELILTPDKDFQALTTNEGFTLKRVGD